MKEICRLCLYGDGTEAMRDVVSEGLTTAGVSFDDISVKTGDSETHYGNWCLTPVLDNEALYKLAKALTNHNAHINMRRFLLEQSDIDELQVGDKVRVQYTNGLAGQSADKGTVINKGQVQTGTEWDYETHRPKVDENGHYIPVYTAEVIIRRYRSRSKGWRFRSGDQTGIWKGWEV